MTGLRERQRTLARTTITTAAAELVTERHQLDFSMQEVAERAGVSLRTVERAVAPLRQALRAEARATVRFETPPGHQLQIDFGECWAPVAGARTKLHLFVATLGYSRRNFAAVFRHRRQSAWFAGMEAALHHFGGVPEELLFDNDGALVEHHDVATREVRFNKRLHAFACYWGFRPRACAPYRARTKGKDERGVGYVKHNAIAGHAFASWAALEAHLAWWMREISDPHIHGTTGEPPIERFRRDEAAQLRGRPAAVPTDPRVDAPGLRRAEAASAAQAGAGGLLRRPGHQCL